MAGGLKSDEVRKILLFAIVGLFSIYIIRAIIVLTGCYVWWPIYKIFINKEVAALMTYSEVWYNEMYPAVTAFNKTLILACLVELIIPIWLIRRHGRDNKEKVGLPLLLVIGFFLAIWIVRFNCKHLPDKDITDTKAVYFSPEKITIVGHDIVVYDRDSIVYQDYYWKYYGAYHGRNIDYDRWGGHNVFLYILYHKRTRQEVGRIAFDATRNYQRLAEYRIYAVRCKRERVLSEIKKLPKKEKRPTQYAVYWEICKDLKCKEHVHLSMP